MRPRDSIVAWRDTDEWTTHQAFGLQPCTHGRLTTGYYLLVPVASEKEGLELAKRLQSAPASSPGHSEHTSCPGYSPEKSSS